MPGFEYGMEETRLPQQLSPAVLAVLLEDLVEFNSMFCHFTNKYKKKNTYNIQKNKHVQTGNKNSRKTKETSPQTKIKLYQTHTKYQVDESEIDFTSKV